MQAKLRDLIAQEAARLLHDEAARDYRQAREKACQRLGVNKLHDLPTYTEIHTALIDYLKIFKLDSQVDLIQRLRQEALAAMRFFADFEPRLFGPVLDGTASAATPIGLQVFVDASEEIMIHLLNHNIPFEVRERAVKYSEQRVEHTTVFVFLAKQVEIEVFVLPVNALRQAPLSMITNKPMRRANPAKLEKMLEADALFVEH